MKSLAFDILPGLIGGLVGGLLGYLVLTWVVKQGFDAPVLVGAFAGLGCGMASRTDSNPRGLICAILALIGGLLSQWKLFNFSFTVDGSLAEFAAHIHKIPPITLLLIVLGGFLGFYWGREWTLRPRRSRTDAEG